MKQWTLKPSILAISLISCISAGSAEQAKSQSNHLNTYRFDIFGPSEQAALAQAGLHAVRSTAGEFYCSDEMFLARSLLDRYLRNYYGRFIASEKVLSKRESQGNVYMTVSLVVDRDKLEKDLREKRFFYKPRRRPILYVSVAETVDGSPTAGEPISRGAINELLKQLLVDPEGNLVFANPLDSDSTNVDYSEDPNRLVQAREAAQRQGVEVLVTGRVDLTLEGQRPINFDSYTFYRAKANIKMYRVDDGTLLAADNSEAIAGHTDPAKAREVAAYRATAEILNDRIPKFSQDWERTMTDHVDFQVMIVGVDEPEAEVIRERLATRLGPVEVYRRSRFEDVVVFNVYYPPEALRPDEQRRIEHVLSDIQSPQLKITPIQAKKKIRAQNVS